MLIFYNIELISGKKMVIRVLLVEDDELCRKLGLMVLGLFDNVEATSASTGSQALTLYEKEPFDLLIVDLDLPDITGSEIVSLIKNKYKKCPPSVAITAHLAKNSATPHNIDRLYTKPLTYNMFKDILTLVH